MNIGMNQVGFVDDYVKRSDFENNEQDENEPFESIPHGNGNVQSFKAFDQISIRVEEKVNCN